MKEKKFDSTNREEKVYITIECSIDEYNKLTEASSSQNQVIEDYVLDKALKARNRKSSNSKDAIDCKEAKTSMVKRQKTKNKSRNISTAMVKLQQTKNELLKEVMKHEDNEEELKLLEKVQERMDVIWDS